MKLEPLLLATALNLFLAAPSMAQEEPDFDLRVTQALGVPGATVKGILRYTGVNLRLAGGPEAFLDGQTVYFRSADGGSTVSAPVGSLMQEATLGAPADGGVSMVNIFTSHAQLEVGPGIAGYTIAVSATYEDGTVAWQPTTVFVAPTEGAEPREPATFEAFSTDRRNHIVGDTAVWVNARGRGFVRVRYASAAQEPAQDVTVRAEIAVVYANAEGQRPVPQVIDISQDATRLAFALPTHEATRLASALSIGDGELPASLGEDLDGDGLPDVEVMGTARINNREHVARMRFDYDEATGGEVTIRLKASNPLDVLGSTSLLVTDPASPQGYQTFAGDNGDFGTVVSVSSAANYALIEGKPMMASVSFEATPAEGYVVPVDAQPPLPAQCTLLPGEGEWSCALDTPGSVHRIRIREDQGGSGFTITSNTHGDDPNIGAFGVASIKIVDEAGRLWNRSTTPQTRVYTASASFDGLSSEGVGDGEERIFVLETFDADGTLNGADGGTFVPGLGIMFLVGNLGDRARAMEYVIRVSDDI